MPQPFRDAGTELPRLTPGEGIGSFHPHWGQTRTGPALLAKVVGGVTAVPAADGVGERQGGGDGGIRLGRGLFDLGVSVTPARDRTTFRVARAPCNEGELTAGDRRGVQNL
eukprot:3936061-Rhodomonas_salina.1